MPRSGQNRQRNNERNRHIRGVDLFCGAGGLTRGLEAAGIDVAFGVDLDPDCEYPYQSNNKAKFVLKTVEDLSAADFEKAFDRAKYKLIAGCAPCQPFSTYQRGKGGPEDGRWNLLEHFGRLVKEVEPDLVTMENVPRLQHQKIFFDFVADLREEGFEVSHAVVNCIDYGVPQQRQRLVLLASKLGPIEMIAPTTPDGQRRTVRDAIHKLLNEYCASREKTCGGTGATGTRFVNGLLKKRLFSSPAAFASTLEKHIDTLTGQQPQAKPHPMSDRILRKAILRAEEDYADDGQVEIAQTEAVEEATKRSAPPTDAELRMLQRMRAWAQSASHKVDSKARAILDWTGENLRPDGHWNNCRVILFTEYRTTHKWLHEILASHGFGGDRLAIIHGGMDHEEREKVKAAFQTNPNDAEVRILLATDAASEGIDLQNYCNCLIHVEIPYNPNVMEQRNGRIDRHGQKHDEVLIWHPVDGGEANDDALGGHKDDIIRALTKLEAMREDMGSVNPVIAPQMAGLIEGTRRELDTREAEARAAKAKRYVRAERELKERIARLHERLLETRRDFHLSPERICAAVKTGLALDKRPPLKPAELAGAPSGTVFEMPALTGSWARCMEGLRHPHTGKLRPITFDHEVAKGRDDVVLVHLNHRLVQMCLRLMRAEVWAQSDVKKLHRIDVRSLPSADLEDIAVAVVSRLVITGGNHHRLHEELTVAGGYLKDGAFSRETRVTQVNRWLDEARSIEASERLFEGLKRRFDRHQDSILQSVESRSRDRLRNLENTLESRKQQEIRNITAVLDELQRGIEQELKKAVEPEQLVFRFPNYTDAERLQVRRDTEALRQRLSRIPEEKREESEAIRQRFDGYAARTFPVAVIFLVPEDHPWRAGS